MRWLRTVPQPEAERRRLKFLLFPRAIGDSWVWLEFVWRVERWTISYSVVTPIWGWEFARYEVRDDA